MPNTDRILEAEDSIKNIAVELKRMRDAATILEASQEKTDVFLRSAERLMQVTENFYSQCRTIVEKLSEADLDQRLNGIQTGLDTVTADVQKHATAADEAQSDLVTSLRQITADLGTHSIAAHGAHANLDTSLQQISTDLQTHTTAADGAHANLETKLADLGDGLLVLSRGMKSAAKEFKVRQTVTIVLIAINLTVVAIILSRTLNRWGLAQEILLSLGIG
jgi:uncharacterized phage infection (PIP) family protein YhgE